MTSNFSSRQISHLQRIAIAVTTLTVCCASSASLLAQSADALADQQRIKRMEENLLLNQSVAEARKLTAAGEYAKAQARYEDILSKTPNVSNGVDIRKEAQKGLANIYAVQANQAAKQQEYAKARSLIEQATELEPTNASYQALLKQYKANSLTVAERFPENTVADENLQERVNRIQQLFYEGDSYTNTGQFTRAESKFNEILKIDRHNQAAMKKLKEITLKKRRIADMRREALKEKAMADVTSNWDEIRSKRSNDEAPVLVTEQFEPSNVGQIYDKLESIRIPELNFTEVDVADAVAYLREQSKALDPTGEGVNLVLKTESTNKAPVAEGETAVDNTIRTLTLDLRDMPLIKVLEFISTLTNLKFKVEEYAVYIFPSNETSDVKVVRSFSVPPTFFSGTALNAENAGIDVKGELENKGVKFTADTSAAYLPKTAKLVVRNTLEQINLIEQLVAKESEETIQISIETKFIEFSEDKLKDFSSNLRISADTNIPTPFNVPVSAFNGGGALQPGGGAFVPPINVDAFNNATGVAGADGIPDFTSNPGAGNAGKVRAGFGSALRNSGSLSPNRIDALLGLGINRDPALMGFSGVLGSSGFRYLLTAIESTFGGDLMSAPKVTLINGQKSKIRVVREFYYPEEYEPPEVDLSSTASGGASVSVVTVTPSNPTDFVSRDLGVTLDVKANATADRRIDLELSPEVIEFQGFINYGEGVNSSSTITGLVTPITTSDNLKPVFSTRKIETKVQVIDGQTVVMAGFIRNDEQEINDKIPFLGDLPLVGRAFRSKSTQSVKKNLMMFVTARMINSDGTPKFLTEEEAEAFGLASQIE